MAEKKKGKKKPKKESGVFVDEISSGARPIEGVGTAVAAFVGFIGLSPLSPFRLATTTVVAVAAVAVIRRRMSD